MIGSIARPGPAGHRSAAADLRARIAALDRAAAGLEAACVAVGGRPAPFRLALMTDRSRLPTPALLAAMRALPPGAAVVLRDYDAPGRDRLARSLAALARARGLVFVLGARTPADAGLAAAVGAAGLHLPARLAAAWRGPAPLSVACHDAASLWNAAALGARAAFLSPVFATASHPGAPALGVAAFRALAAASPLPVLALGGVDAGTAGALAGPGVAGLAAIGAFAPAPRERRRQR